MVSDYHIHTVLCKHAEGEPKAFKKIAANRNIGEMCFTDHVPAPDGYDPANRMDIGQYDCYREMIRSVSGGEPPRVLMGIEADYYDGCLSFLRDWLPRQPLDFVLGSVHYLNNWGFDNPDERAVWDSVDVKATWRTYFQLIRELAKTRLFDAVAHLDLPKKFGYRPPDAALIEMAKPALDEIAAAGMAIEINSSGLRRPVGEIYPSLMLLEMAREREIPICFGSDAHRPEEVGYMFEESLRLARQAGYTRSLRFSARSRSFHPLPVC